MLKVATHNGTFHADDVFAYAILRAATAGRLELTRTRDAGALAAADLVFDVGGVYDPRSGRYDHHMRDRPRRVSGDSFSSAGLIWQDYGEAAVRALLPAVTTAAAPRVAAKLDLGLIRDIDRMDNGEMPPTPGHVATVIEAFNPSFAEDGRDETAAFLEAAEVAAALLTRVCARAHAAVLAERTVAEAAAAATDPRIVVLERRVPWEEAVFDLDLVRVLYVVRPNGADWSCSAVPPNRGSFEQRLPLPDSWAGLRDAALAEITGVADAVFCHPARFVCGARSRDGALALAALAVAGAPG